MKRHPGRVAPAVLVALPVLAGCVLVALAAVRSLLHLPPIVPLSRLADLGRDLHWRDLAVMVGAGALAVLGLLLVLCAVLPGKPTVLPLADLADGQRGGGRWDTGITRRGMRLALRRGAEDVDGVTRAGLRLRRRGATATVTTRRNDTAGFDGAVREAMGHRLDEIGPARRPVLRVRVIRQEARR